jgi:glycosyltransferase involved in cell wall biosynthesis
VAVVVSKINMQLKKKILIDASKLKYRNTGLGEISFQFVNELVNQYNDWGNKNIDFYILLPKKDVGIFGNKVKYISTNFFWRYFSFVQLKFNLWHALHQDSAYGPTNKNCYYLLTVHDLFAEKRIATVLKKINKANGLAAISNFTSLAINNKLDVKKDIQVIYNGVNNISDIPKTIPKEINENDEFYFHLSSLLPKKNIISLLQMMQLMPQQKLVIAGNFKSKHGKNLLEQIKQLNLKNVISLNDITEAQKAWLYQHCQAFLFPSLLEGFGLPVIEAMHFGKPVFVSTLSSLPEVGSDKAFYFDNFDAVQMKKVLQEKLASVKNNDNFSTTLKKYANNFSWKKNVQTYLKWYDEVLQK